MQKMSEFWSLSEGTFYCLYDQKRTLAFKKAIMNSVKKNDVVLELGAGSGVLSMFAADAGAKRVYAVELDDTNYFSLVKSIKKNGYEKVIIPIKGDATSVEIPEKVDMVICEMIATGLVEELQVPAMNRAHDFMKKDARVLLQEYHIYVDLIEGKNQFYNKIFDVIRYEFPDKTSLRSKTLSLKHILRKIDFRKKQKSTFIKEKFILTVNKNGTLNGLRLGGNTIFADGTNFDYSLSYSFPTILPIADRTVSKGDRFEISISYSLCEGPHRLKYSIHQIT